jgi:hypothetical protein
VRSKSTKCVIAACLIATAVTAIATTPRAETVLERGRYLAETIGACADCRTPKNKRGQPIQTVAYVDGFVIPDKMFTAVAPNIAPDKETGIGAWTDAQIARAIREGIGPDGKVIGPPMPFAWYDKVKPADTPAILEYLGSVKPQVTP